ncbi:hypothetical protein [Mycetocola sp. 2940]|uniref:hypothetical protein n=1 Tax=Mycetocola sp. 2940 TaxID=3156452 RepID=UPI003397B58C
MNELGWLLLAFASTVLATNVALVVVVRSFYKRIRRNLALNATGLRVRARLASGARRDVLKLQLRLKDTLDSGQAAMDLAVRSNGPRGELPQLFRRLRSEGEVLESQLRMLESENDLAVLAEALPTARSRVDQVTQLVRQLRSTVGSGLGEFSDESLTALRSDIDREVMAVRAGMQELHELNGRSMSSESGRQPSTAPSPRIEPGSQR